MRRRTTIGRAGHITVLMVARCGGVAAAKTRMTPAANTPNTSSKSRMMKTSTSMWSVKASTSMMRAIRSLNKSGRKTITT